MFPGHSRHNIRAREGLCDYKSTSDHYFLSENAPPLVVVQGVLFKAYGGKNFGRLTSTVQEQAKLGFYWAAMVCELLVISVSMGFNVGADSIEIYIFCGRGNFSYFL